MRMEKGAPQILAAGFAVLAASAVFPRSVRAAIYLDVVISEIMYHAPGDDAAGEFIEITNRGVQSVDLTGWRLDDGIRYSFPGGTTLSAGDRLVIAANPAAIQTFYGTVGVLGPYEGRLDNAGERIELRDGADALVCEVDYDNDAPWPTGGNDDGRSIELTDLAKNHNVGRFWAPSTKLMGTPGAPNGNGAPPPVSIVINEFLANPAGGSDWVELLNYGTTAVDLNGYYLTDNPKSPTKARIQSTWSAGTTLVPPGGYWISTQVDWGFGLSSTGEQIYLVGSDGQTWIDGYDFGDQFESVSEARYPDGSSDWIRSSIATMGSANVAPTTVTSVVINEIMYHPTDDNGVHPGSEYVEIHNTAGVAVDMSGWALAHGIDFNFPAGTILPAGGYLVVAAEPANVQTTYGITGVLGPYEGKLSNFSNEIELEDRLSNRVDFVEYRQEGLWPAAADGTGPSLELTHYAMDNRLPGVWQASSGTGTPQAANSRSAANPAASIDDVSHSPRVPTSAQAVTVTARVGAGGLTSVKLYHKRDQDGSFSNVDMYDDGLHVDRFAGDGIYGGTLPARADGTTVEFYIQANATGGNRKFPDLPPPLSGLPSPTCLYIVQNTAPTSNLNVFRFILTDENWNSLTGAPTNDTSRDCTFIYGDKVWYNCGVRFRSGSRSGPKYSYKVHLPPGYNFRGADVFNLNFEKGDITCLKNKIVNHLLGYMGLPDAGTEFVHTRWRNAYVGVHLYTEAQDNDYLDNHFPGDSEGNLYKGVAPWTTSAGGYNIAWGGSHGWYEKETNEQLGDWSDLDGLYAALRPEVPDATYEAGVRAKVDVPNWGRSAAVWAATCLIDSPWHINNQNYRLYRRTSDNRFIHLLYDFDDTYWSTMWDNTGAYASVFHDVDRFLKRPVFQREYYHGIWRAVNSTNGVYREARIEPEVAYYHGLIYGDVDADPITGTGSKWTNFVNGPTQWHTWLTGRNALLRGELSVVPLAVTSPASPHTTSTPAVTLLGTAPLSAARLEVFGSETGVQWQSATAWRKDITLAYRDNQVPVRALDDAGNELEQVVTSITYTNGIESAAIFTTGPLPADPPLTVQFYDESQAPDITAWNWDFGDNATSAEQHPTHTYAAYGTYTVTLAITADNGSFTTSNAITVGTPPPSIPGDFDGDHDVDQDDFGQFQVCLSGSGIEQARPACAKARMDGDPDVDADDLNAFRGCMTAPTEEGDPNCN